jgi:hypothetical protein
MGVLLRIAIIGLSEDDVLGQDSIHTPLYYLKSSEKEIEFVLWFLAEGVDASGLVRFTGHADATLTHWLERMGSHSLDWHTHRFRNLVFTVVQMDELYTRARQRLLALVGA